jgi:hypothetical protein
MPPTAWAPYVDAGLFMDITDWWEAGDYEGLESTAAR